MISFVYNTVSEIVQVSNGNSEPMKQISSLQETVEHMYTNSGSVTMAPG